MNLQSISIAMRIRLADLATVVFMTSMTEETGRMIRRKCIERRHLLAKHPLYLLVLIYEDRCFEYKRWFDDILEEINVVESATGMTRNTWKMQLSPRLREWFSDYDNLLRMLYASNTELSHFDTVTTFSIKFGDLLLMALKVLEELRVEVGLAPLQKREFRCLQERITFTRSRCDLTADKTREMLERVKGQINVAFNLVAQRDSKINLAVAEESKHVATLAAPVVFTAWFLYLRLSSLKRKERPLHIAGIGYIREGKVVGMGTTDRDGLSFDIRKETNWHEK
ncbi:hypothetical protein SLS63_006418 [Diaporthe eres]|uniref:Uncharacterized protein n=1 Tax=Diaporthe eres TaxID=83184 RepID=A0ABR1P8F6_DIAER